MASKRVTDFKPHKANANKGSERGEYMIEASLREVGAWRSVGADRNGTIGVGNKTTQKWQEIANPDDVIIVPTDGTKLVIVQRTDLDFDSDDPAVVERTVKAAYYDNRAGEVSMTWDAEQVMADMTAGLDLSDMFRPDELDAIIATIGVPDDTEQPTQEQARATLAERFLVPPFSVLDARQGYWQARKSAWIALGIQSELGRGMENVGMAHPETTSTIDFYSRKRALEAELGKELTKDEAAEIMRGGGHLKNARQDNKDRIAARARNDAG